MNPFEMRMECIKRSIQIEQDRYYAEKERFLNGQRPDYPEYPTDESLFKRIDWMINRINDKGEGYKEKVIWGL